MWISSLQFINGGRTTSFAITPHSGIQLQLRLQDLHLPRLVYFRYCRRIEYQKIYDICIGLHRLSYMSIILSEDLAIIWTPSLCNASATQRNTWSDGTNHIISSFTGLFFLRFPLKCFFEFMNFSSARSISFSNAVMVASFLPVNCFFPCSLY